jgi:isoleucyl-tRNA synthetase
VRPPHAEAGQALQRLQGAVLDELNVKELQLLEPGTAFETYHLKPNLPVVGPKHGRAVPAIRAALAALSPADAAAAVRKLQAGEPFALALAGSSPVPLGPDDVLVETAAPEGFRFSEEEGYLVALDTALDEALMLEGLAREVVRQVQEARKEAGLAVSDRITTYLEGASAQVAAAIAAHRAYILGETLSGELRLEGPPAEAYVKAVTLEEEGFTLGILRSAPPSA